MPVLVFVMYCLLGFIFSAYDEVRIPCGAHKATHHAMSARTHADGIGIGIGSHLECVDWDTQLDL